MSLGDVVDDPAECIRLQEHSYRVGIKLALHPPTNLRKFNGPCHLVCEPLLLNAQALSESFIRRSQSQDASTFGSNRRSRWQLGGGTECAYALPVLLFCF